jgi:hypothetical protein
VQQKIVEVQGLDNFFQSFLSGLLEADTVDFIVAKLQT